MQLQSRIHWLSMTIREHVSRVLEMVAENVYGYAGADSGGFFAAAAHGGLGYESLFVGQHGVRVYHSAGREDVHVVIPGAACEAAVPEYLFRFFPAPRVAFKRIDLALDGVTDTSGKPLCPQWLYKMLRDEPDKVKTWANLCGENSLAYHENRQGKTATVGSRTSSRFLRVYDRRGSTRFELEIKGKRAQRVAEVMDGKTPNHLGALVVGFLRDFIEFVDDKRSGALQAWWAAVVGGAESIKVAMQQTLSCINRRFEWCKLQVSASLHLFAEASGGSWDFVSILVNEGLRKENARHRVLLAQAGGPGGWLPR
jgi:DNA relaxase NicK